MKRLLIPIIILAFLIFPQFALGSDLDDLKAAGEKLTQAWNNIDADTIASMEHPGRVSYFYVSAFPDVAPIKNFQEHITKSLKMHLSNLESISINPYNMQYRVIGNTGLMWGHLTVYEKLKGEKMKTWYARHTSTWIKSNGKWLCIMTHNSPIPPSD